LESESTPGRALLHRLLVLGAGHQLVSWAKVCPHCPGGGIGRRASLRC
jgi:hypothetical protein